MFIPYHVRESSVYLLLCYFMKAFPYRGQLPYIFLAHFHSCYCCPYLCYFITMVWVWSYPKQKFWNLSGIDSSVVERWNHNPRVMSSSLTGSINFHMQSHSTVLPTKLSGQTLKQKGLKPDQASDRLRLQNTCPL